MYQVELRGGREEDLRLEDETSGEGRLRADACEHQWPDEREGIGLAGKDDTGRQGRMAAGVCI